MSVVEILSQIRVGWLSRLSHHMAKGATVRDVLREQLAQFYDGLIQAVMSGDPAWLNPIIGSWLDARTASELGGEQTSLLPVFVQVHLVTNDYLQQTIESEKALSAIIELTPFFTYIFQQVAEKEAQVKVDELVKELEITQGVLHKVERTKSDFISVAAHELKTPLTLIEGYAMMLRDMYPASDQTSYPVLLLKGVDNGTRRLREIVDDMIDVSLIDNKMLTLNFQPLWVGRLLSGLQEELIDSIKSRRLKLEILDFPGAKDMTFGDSERMYQAFRNLLTNAIKYTPDGGRITVGGRRLPGFIEVTFEDTGIGIDPSDHIRIFEKFGQLGNIALHSSGKTKYKGGGPGLGLPITKGIIEAHGGSIWVESDGFDEESFPGTTFHVLIPWYKSAPDDKLAHLFKPLMNSPEE